MGWQQGGRALAVPMIMFALGACQPPSRGKTPRPPATCAHNSWHMLQLQGRFAAASPATHQADGPLAASTLALTLAPTEAGWQAAEQLWFAWSHSGAQVRFVGPPPAFVLQQPPGAQHTLYFTLQLDALPPLTVPLTPGQTQLALPPAVAAAVAGDRRDHQLQLRRQSEAFLGASILGGVAAGDATEILAPQPQRRPRLLFIGDSITAGYGNLGHGPHCPFRADQQAVALSWGPLAATSLAAEADIIAYSGKGVWRNRDGGADDTMAQLWTRVLPQLAQSALAPTLAPIYQAVVINLGTNDLAVQPFDLQGFVDAQLALWRQVRRYHRQAHLVVVVGPMLTDEAPPKVSQLQLARQASQQALAQIRAGGENNISLLLLPMDDHSLGLGCDYHPSLARHRAMAAQLVAHLRPRLP